MAEGGSLSAIKRGSRSCVLSLRRWLYFDEASACFRAAASWKEVRPNTPSEAKAMTKCLLYMAPIALIGLMATEAHAVPVVWSNGMARNVAIATADARGAPLVLVQRGGGRGGGGGGFRGGGGGGYRGGGGYGGGGGKRGEYG